MSYKDKPRNEWTAEDHAQRNADNSAQRNVDNSQFQELLDDLHERQLETSSRLEVVKSELESVKFDLDTAKSDIEALKLDRKKEQA